MKPADFDRLEQKMVVDETTKTCRPVAKTSTTSLLSSEFEDKLSAMALLQEVAKRFQKNLEQNVARLTFVRKCMLSEDSSEKCKSDVDRFKSFTNEKALALRREQALTTGRPPDGELSPVGLFYFPKVSEADMARDELDEAKRAFDLERKSVAADIEAELDRDKKISGSERPDASSYRQRRLKEEHAKRANEHRENWRKILYREAPILLHLPAPKANGNQTQWDDVSFLAALDGTIASANREIAITKNALDEGKLEFGRVDGERLKKSFVQGKRDLLDYIAFSDVVDEVLSDPKFTAYCGVAAALHEHYSNKQTQNTLAVAGISTVAFVATGGASAVAQGAGYTGVALAGAATMGGIGLGMSGAELWRSAEDAKVAKRQVGVRSGAFAEVEKAVVDAKVVDETEKALLTSLATAPLGLGVGGGGAKAARSVAAQTLAKAAVDRSRESLEGIVALVAKASPKELKELKSRALSAPHLKPTQVANLKEQIAEAEARVTSIRKDYKDILSTQGTEEPEIVALIQKAEANGHDRKALREALYENVTQCRRPQ